MAVTGAAARRASRAILGVLLAAASPLVTAQVIEAPVPGDPVAVDGGRIAGKLLPSGVRAYFGIPFAAPPLRDLRWREPQPVRPWQGIRYTAAFAPECIQTLRAHDINHYFGDEATSEDCLHLNIWAPPRSADETPRPVVVWIYGGGFTIGSAAMANYHGESLARQGVVYLTVAYRVGALGFLAHPQLTAESANRSSGNYGFLDQIAALQWVQRNIERFGGDPANVTIMGQSAGSMSVSVLQASPLARGLFHRAVGMSGAAFGTATAIAPQPLAEAEAMGPRLQEHLKGASIGAMRSLPADRILQAQLAVPVRYGPIIDGYLLPARPEEIFATGKQNDVPILIGFTRDESFSELARARTLNDYREAARRIYGTNAEKLLALYPASDDTTAQRAAVDAARDSSVSLQMRSWARAQVKTGTSPVYAYLFSRVHPYVSGVRFSDHDPDTVGAYHTADVPYWLGTLESLNLFRKTREWSDADRALSDAMSGALVSFARSGNPNPDGGRQWPQYRPDRERIRELGGQDTVIGWPNRSRLDFFAANPPQPPASLHTTGADFPVAAQPVLDDRYPPRETRFADGVIGLAELVYSTPPGFRPLRLDLYRPASASSPRPLVIYIHGGGWQSGHTRHSGAFENWPAVLAALAARGYVVSSIEYRLSGEAQFPAAIDDVRAALRWLRSKAGNFGIDPQRVLVWGGSAGGHLAALAAMQCEADCVQGLIAWYGIFDFSTLAGSVAGEPADSPPGKFLGCNRQRCDSTRLAAASPISFVRAGAPPVLMIHGADDRVVPIQQSRAFLARLEEQGVKATLLALPGVDHSFIGPSVQATRAASERAIDESFRFIDRTLQASP
jgi:para-nitrobenzyl esterase